ncbi:MAG TPA: SAM-dependent chlorinase/fluorinase [Longimicrobiales bacterium]
MSGRPPRITLLTDFGTADGYVAAMKGVIAAILPGAIIDDASHDIPPGDVHAASWALDAYWHLYPAGTVHVVVVDPGVGSARRALALEVDRRFIIAPDNGIVTAALRRAPLARAVEIRTPHRLRDTVSATFHGRDVFAPAAAHIATGAPLEELGPPVTDPVLIALPEPARTRASVAGTVVHVDRFGNLVTNIPAADVRGGAVAVGARRRIPVVRTYADVPSGECAALIGSRGALEVSVRDGSAAEVLAAERGTVVVWSADGSAGTPADAAPEF